MDITRVILIRHGETNWNLEGRMQGHRDSPLTDLGLAQARAVAACLATENIDALYSSDLQRAFLTARQIAEKTGHEIRVDPRLRERHLGIFQGLTREEMEARYPVECAAYRNGGPDYQVSGGQSARQHFQLSVSCLTELAGQHSGELLVIVTHGGVVASLLRHALGIPLETPRRFALYNGALNRFSVERGHWRLLGWGDTAHLRGLGTTDDD
jgi:probable phosphoglycerate mutase